jgi:hypothetical protein
MAGAMAATPKNSGFGRRAGKQEREQSDYHRDFAKLIHKMLLEDLGLELREPRVARTSHQP